MISKLELTGRRRYRRLDFNDKQLLVLQVEFSTYDTDTKKWGFVWQDAIKDDLLGMVIV